MKPTSQLLTKGAVSLLITTLLFGIFGVLSRLIGYTLPVFYLAAFRSFTTAGILFVFLQQKHSFTYLTLHDGIWITLRSIGGMVGVVGFFIAVNAVPLGTSYFILYVGILITGFLLSKLMFHEKLDGIHYAALCCAILGLSFLYTVILEQSSIGYFLLLFASGIGAAVWNTFPKNITAAHSSESLAFWDNFIGAILTFLYSLFAGEQWVLPTVSAVWGYNLIFSILMVGTGQLIVYGFRHIDSHIGNIFMLGEVLFGVLFGYLFYNEIISVRAGIGGILIIFAMALPDIYELIRVKRK